MRPGRNRGTLPAASTELDAPQTVAVLLNNGHSRLIPLPFGLEQPLARIRYAAPIKATIGPAVVLLPRSCTLMSKRSVPRTPI